MVRNKKQYNNTENQIKMIFITRTVSTRTKYNAVLMMDISVFGKLSREQIYLGAIREEWNQVLVYMRKPFFIFCLK